MKKKMLNDLSPGQKFRYNRKIYVVDEFHCSVCFSNGKIDVIPFATLVTPVKVSIVVKK